MLKKQNRLLWIFFISMTFLICKDFRALAQDIQLVSQDHSLLESSFKIQDRQTVDESKRTVGALPAFSTDAKVLSRELDAFCDEIYKDQVDKMKASGGKRVFFSYKQYRHKDRFLSLVIHASIDPGNTQSDEVHAIVFDLKSLKEVSLQDILGENALLRSNQWIRDGILRSKNEGFFMDALMRHDLVKKAAFYLDANGDLVFIFDKYEIGPGALGTPEIRVPAEQLLKQYSRLLVIDNGIEQTKKGPIRILEGQVTLFLPLRDIAEALGWKVNYNKQTAIVSLERGKIRETLDIHIKAPASVLGNGTKRVWDGKFITDQGHLFIPVEILASLINCNVEMDQSLTVVKECPLMGDTVHDRK